MRLILLLRIIPVIFLCSLFVSKSQVSQPNFVNAERSFTKMNIDGIPDEPVWQKAVRISNFTQRELNNGSVPTEKTEIAVAYDDENFYFFAFCYDSEPSKITAKSMKRDCEYYLEDNLELFIDTYHDKRNGYLLITTPYGSRSDALLGADGEEYNEDWNGVWDVVTNINEQGWFAEFVVPISTFKFKNDSNQTWGFNIERNVRRKREQLVWQGWSRDFHPEKVSVAGEIRNLINVKPRNLVEIKPYALAGASFEQGNGTSDKYKIGLDATYLVTPTLKLNATFNTDFAQVESDQAQINLTRFSQYYPEKREFFLEGKDFFEFSLGGDNSLFYSRNIGIYGDKEIPIIGGLRLLGKSENTNIGIMTLQTENKFGLASTNYSIVRIKQDVLANSSVGIIATTKSNENEKSAAFACDLNYTTTNFLGNKRLTVSGLIAKSAFDNKIGGNDLAYTLYAGYPNDMLYMETSYSNIQEDFIPNLGFVPRNNYKNYYVAGKFKIRPQSDWIKYIEIKPVHFNFYWNDKTGALESGYMEIRLHDLTIKSNDQFVSTLTRNFERLDEDFKITSNITIPKGEYSFNRYGFSFNSFQGRVFSVSTGFSVGQFYDGTRDAISGSFKYNVSSHFNCNAAYTRSKIRFDYGEFNTNEVSARLEYSFNTKLYASLYGQWNNASDMVILNFRTHWIPAIGSDCYFVINQNIDGSTQKWLLKNTSIIAKFSWRFALETN